MYSKPKSNRIELESPKTEEEKGQRWEEDEGRERNGAWKVLIWLEGGWIAYLKTTNQLEQFD